VSINDLPLFQQRYPHVPGSKTNGTSAIAAKQMRPKARTLRDDVFDVLKKEKLTADEVAAKLGKSILSIRPRLSELNTLQKIEETGERRENESGASASVWRAKT
jgi:predicted Rossmann fold nucleotide-binding protein DprA/Smf involved in DNA uptake